MLIKNKKTQHKIPQQGMNNIMKRLDSQENSINQLLLKYGGELQKSHFPQQEYRSEAEESKEAESRLQNRSSRLQAYNVGKTNVNNLQIISRLSQSEQKDKYILPSVLRRLSKSKEKKKRVSPVNKIRDHLYNAYGKNNKFVPHNKISRIEKNPKTGRQKLTPITPAQTIKSKREENQKQINEKSFQLEVDLSQVDSDDTEEEEVTTTYYQRQFRQMMRTQCMEELNFLYFSKNQVMKDWTETLLSMLERHDKQIVSVRRKSRYLQNFDDNFFTIGIFQDD